LTTARSMGSDSYIAERALAESTRLAEMPCVVEFCEAVSGFVRDGGDEATFRRLAADVAREARRRGFPAERMMTAFRIADCRRSLSAEEGIDETTAFRRYMCATEACLAAYFAWFATAEPDASS
jgi:hypothetical protein